MFFIISSFLLLSNFASGQSPPASESQCIPLETSTLCTEYKNYSILAFDTIATAADFDAYILSQSAFYFPNCTNWSNPKNTTIRYSTSFVCGYAVYFSTLLAPASSRCNQASDPSPMPVCQASIQITLDDVRSNLQSKCPSVALFSQYRDFAPALKNSSCLVAVGPDVSLKCGYSNSNDAAAYCKANPTALCCTSTNNIISPSTQSSTQGASATSSTAATSAPTSEPNTSASTASSATVSPLLIGAAALGLALLAVLGSVLYFMTKKKPDDEMHPGDEEEEADKDGNRKSIIGEENPETMECVFEYKANLFDELTLEVGDEVGVISKFDDGWALGHNLTSGKEGTFPLACLAPFGAGSELRYRDSRFESQYSKRESSIRYTVDSSTFSRPY